MAKQTFTTGQVLSAAQLTSLQQTAMGGGSATAKTASYVLVAADAGTTVAMNAAGATTITVNTGLFAAGDTVFIQNLGAGACTVTAGTATVATAGSLILPQNDAGILYFTATGASIFYDFIQAGAVSPLTTKGDVYTFSTSDARLGVGANDTVLTADSAEATGMKWATPGAAATSYTLLNSGGTTLSGASTTISSIGGYNKYFITYINATVSAATCSVQFRLNADATSKYNNIGPYYIIFTSGAVFGQDVNATTKGSLGRAASGQTANGYLLIDGANSSGIKTWFGLGSGESTSGQARFFGGVYTGTSVVTSITFHEDGAASFTGGTVYVYGAN